MFASSLGKITRSFLYRQKAKTAIPTDQSQIMSYIEFQTHLIDLAQVASGRQMQTAKALQRMLDRPNFFMDKKKHHELCFMWPYKGRERKITILATPSGLEFFFQNQIFLTLQLNGESKLIAEKKTLEERVWPDQAIEQLVSNFKEALQIDCGSTPSFAQDKPYHYDKKAFKQMLKAYSNYELTYRIQKTMIEGGSQRLNDFTLRLDWPYQGEVHKLKLVFSRAQRFSRDFNAGELYSWLLTEESLFAHFPHYRQYHIEPGQYYYCLRAYEINKNEGVKEEHQVLALWLALDGFVGELRTVHATPTFPGNAVLTLFSLLDRHLFQMKNTVICDASNLFNEDKSIKIPLRLILSLGAEDVESGKSWYQRKLPGLGLFNCHQFKTSADRVITQDSFVRDQALAELQALPLDSWSQMLDQERQEQLQALRDRYLDKDEKQTLNMLVMKVHEHARAEKSITPDLALLVKLLCENTRVFKDTKPFAQGDADFWVKSRVEELLGKSRFWLRERQEERPAPEEDSVRERMTFS